MYNLYRKLLFFEILDYCNKQIFCLKLKCYLKCMKLVEKLLIFLQLNFDFFGLADFILLLNFPFFFSFFFIIKNLIYF
jgi:hypothetical protein